MFTNIRRWVSQFFNRSRTINNEPLNKVSLIGIILIDIFILINVFAGLNDISQWHLSPSQTYPCYAEWGNYRAQTTKNKDYEILRLSLFNQVNNRFSFQETYQRAEVGHLGKVSEVCLNYANLKDKIDTPENQRSQKTIEEKQAKISRLEQSNSNIRKQYDSTLLEKIAKQPREQSINAIAVEKAKQTLDQNNREISTLQAEISTLQNQLLSKPESTQFLALLKDGKQFSEVEAGYQKAEFWYPTIQLFFQALFLLPLILIALFVNNLAQRRGYGLIALMSWHLLVIFLIPLILKIFEFLQVGVLFQFLFDIVSVVFGGLLFLVSYLYIFLIPLLGFGLIKFFQKFVFNPKVQAANRVQSLHCIRCAKKLRQQDSHCPHCGYYQYVECQNCHDLTYKKLPYCKQCGVTQRVNNM
jgi:RNA polymerase subunit RPABC4/transcription elongation factor Spt4